jgi:DEAD/DEAH box helicase domain-containing protein
MVALSRHDGSKASPTVPRAQEKAYTQHAVARLLHWLATASDGTDQDAGIEPLQRSAAWLGFLMIPSTAEDKAACEHQMGRWLPRLPLHIREPGKGFAPSVSKPNGPMGQVGWWPMSLANGLPAGVPWSAPGVVLLDEANAGDEEVLHRDWRRWLQVFNTAQFLPAMLLATAAGLDGHDYEAFIGAGGTVPTPGQPATQVAMSNAWTEILGQVVGMLKPGLTLLAHSGALLPEVGMELADEKGMVLADAELAWSAARLVVLRPDQEDLADSWQRAQWEVVVLDATLSLAGGQPWQSVVAQRLGVELKNSQE